MASTKKYRWFISLVIAGLVLFTIVPEEVFAYHGHDSFYDDPNYYGSRYAYRYPYYTHHQYHYVSYRDHYRQYNRYYHYPPPRYYRSKYRYYPCLPEYDCYHPWE